MHRVTFYEDILRDDAHLNIHWVLFKLWRKICFIGFFASIITITFLYWMGTDALTNTATRLFPSLEADSVGLFASALRWIGGVLGSGMTFMALSSFFRFYRCQNEITEHRQQREDWRVIYLQAKNLHAALLRNYHKRDAGFVVEEEVKRFREHYDDVSHRHHIQEGTYNEAAAMLSKEHRRIRREAKRDFALPTPIGE
jgi:hypothetical protein